MKELRRLEKVNVNLRRIVLNKVKGIRSRIMDVYKRKRNSKV